MSRMLMGLAEQSSVVKRGTLLRASSAIPFLAHLSENRFGTRDKSNRDSLLDEQSRIDKRGAWLRSKSDSLLPEQQRLFRLGIRDRSNSDNLFPPQCRR